MIPLISFRLLVLNKSKKNNAHKLTKLKSV